MRKSPEFEVRTYLNTDLLYFSHALVGLQQLATEGVITLKERLNWQAPQPTNPRDLIVLIIEVRPYGHDRWSSLAYDIWDQNYLFCQTSLANTDVYYKFSYHPPNSLASARTVGG